MEFRLCETWWITSDRHCFKLCKVEKKNGKDGLVEWLNPEMYFTNLKSLLKAWVDEKIKESKSKTTKDLIEDIKKVSEELDRVYDKINKGFSITINEFNKENGVKKELENREE